MLRWWPADDAVRRSFPRWRWTSDSDHAYALQPGSTSARVHPLKSLYRFSPRSLRCCANLALLARMTPDPYTR